MPLSAGSSRKECDQPNQRGDGGDDEKPFHDESEPNKERDNQSKHNQKCQSPPPLPAMRSFPRLWPVNPGDSRLVRGEAAIRISVSTDCRD